MKKMLFVFTALCFTLSACIPAAFRPQATSPAPVLPDIQATVAVQVEQTVQSMPTPSLAPSNTPVVITATSAPTQTQLPPTSTATITATQNPPQSTLTATLGTSAATMTAGTAGTLPFTATANPSLSATPTGTSHYQYYGTMPPNLPSGNISLINMSKRDGYISLQCTTTDGYTTVVEYPVGGSTVNAKIPAGQYYYVAWVGGQQFSGSFKLGKSQDRKILMYKDRIEVK
jgi:hypothetical protein